MKIVLLIIAAVLLMVILSGALFIAVVAYHEWRWRKIISNKYKQNNHDTTRSNR